MRVLFAFAVLLTLVCALPAARAVDKIDRHALVTRHNPFITAFNPDAPLTVGNGGFAFGCDITGLQTFADEHQRNGIPVETQSRWCWVTDENPGPYTLADASRPFTLPDGSVRPYPTVQSSPAGDWLRKNPRSQPLGQISLEWEKPDGSAFVAEDIQEPRQTLDLWTGVVTSRFKLDGTPVEVVTACAPDSDTLAISVTSDLVAQGRLHVRLAFPRGHNLGVKNTPNLDWSKPDLHRTTIVDSVGAAVARAASSGSSAGVPSGGGATILRAVGGTDYQVRLAWNGLLALRETAPHALRLSAAANRVRSIAVFADFRSGHATIPQPVDRTVLAKSAAHWQEFWETTAAVDFSGSTHSQAGILEKSIILSRYLMAVQMAGDAPPQESGLTCNTWYGKHHTEMIYWHTAHFALWGSDALLARNLAWFKSQLPAARELARERGLRGARWAKMTGPVMRESPGGNPLIVWNQPHMVYLSELLYRNAPTLATLGEYRDLVLETAECIASMVHWNAARQQYDLGPPLWIAQEIYDPAASRNPAYELAYWRWSLETAQQWRTRLGLSRDETWDHILTHLAPLPQKDGKYVALGSHPDTWDNIASRHDHPTMLAPLGILPGGARYVDRATMERTLEAVLKTWDWETKIWGWDYPMIAMSAARLGHPEIAVEVLLRDGPNNRYLPTGHCPQRSDEKRDAFTAPGARKREIAAYLPANGAFLNAVALMVAGWDGCTEAFPGFPKDGTWKIRAEGLRRTP